MYLQELHHRGIESSNHFTINDSIPDDSICSNHQGTHFPWYGSHRIFELDARLSV